MSPQAGDSGQVGNGNSSGGEFHEAAIGFGSNLGQSCAILQAAWQALQAHPDIFSRALSSPYRSQPVDMESAHWFVNAVALIRTRLTPHSLLHLLHAIEARYGRLRNPQAHGCQDRTLDLDLLFYDELVLHDDQVIIPHPRMEQRLFVLEPLAEIAGNRNHPLSRKTMSALCADLKKNVGNQIVEKLSWDKCIPDVSPKE
jgi:2-amino-4-hydroxy-6-hydroxymethyldihydropteridine diphosphokinase